MCSVVRLDLQSSPCTDELLDSIPVWQGTHAWLVIEPLLPPKLEYWCSGWGGSGIGDATLVVGAAGEVGWDETEEDWAEAEGDLEDDAVCPFL